MSVTRDVRYDHSSHRTIMIGDDQPTFPVVASSGGNFFTRAQNVFVTGSQFFGVHGNYNVCNIGLL